jgi:RNA-directed DNA polymerase
MPKLIPIDFARLEDFSDLPGWLGVNVAKLASFLATPDKFYTKKRLNKRRRPGKSRIVYEVDRELAALQRHIARSISRVRTFPDYVHGYVGGRSIVTNAAKHCAKKIVVCVDLSDFFGSIRHEAVRTIFLVLGCGEIAAEALATLCTLNNSLPQGASTSPILSNLAVRALDEDFLALSNVFKSTYSRYADDLCFSGDDVPAIDQIEKVAKVHGFSINHEKTRYQPRGRCQYVTGLTVCDAVAPRVRRAFKRNLRLALHYAERFGVEQHCDNSGENQNALLGRVCFVNGVEPALGERFFQQYNNAVAKDQKK